MKLGAFSVSLAAKDLYASTEFYVKLGFKVFAGSAKQNYLILKNGNALIGLFQGIFENNILTFNPGWDEYAQKMEAYDDIRDIQKSLKADGVPLLPETDENGTGPGSVMISDPDSNVFLLDQHIRTISLL
ncbi:VOC family protein [Flagellimonas sp.]|uniref:VOC family protein n=1 Tax=Flagellimonas sp. TaxID=2058762 RepID=UPI003BB09715